MRGAQLVVTAVFAFFGGFVFQFLQSKPIEAADSKNELTVNKITVLDDSGAKVGIWDGSGITTNCMTIDNGKGRKAGGWSDQGIIAYQVRIADDKAKVAGKWDAAGILVGDGTPDGACGMLKPAMLAVWCNGKKQSSMIAASADPDGADFFLKYPDGNSGISLSTATGQAQINVNDSDAKLRVGLSLIENKATVATLDSKGKPTGSIGGK